MTGTAATEAKELSDVYSLDVVVVPTALPMARKDYPDVVFRNEDGKYRAIMVLSKLLTDVGVDHDVLNAKPESAMRESEIVAQAGRKYSITIATNMAGRGTDILLGGNATYFARALARRELVSLNEELNSMLRDTKQPILIEDEMLPVDISEEATETLGEAVRTLAEEDESQLSSLTKIDEVVGIAAEYAPIPERKHGLKLLREALSEIKDELEEVVAEEREEVLDLGGLYVIGTDRAESRRVDNQLRGRAGRQGDPGGSRFFLALEDRLFRVFGGDKVTGILDKFRVDENTPIENPLVNRTLNEAQRNVEAYFREIREQLFRYDSVFSRQREVFYTQRRKIVVADDQELYDRFREECIKTISEIIPGYVGRGDAADDFEKLSSKLSQFFVGMSQIEARKLQEASNLKECVTMQMDMLLTERRESMELQKVGLSREVVRYLWLTQMDNLWLEHMKSLDYLKEFIVLRSYEGEDPLQAYQREGFELFTAMVNNVRRNNVFSFFQYRLNT
ncbi:Protein translocase subunit SecA [Gracilaria domingensis]|nr:Protein translocase subunit SecA [Gracilaria domingensis]